MMRYLPFVIVALVGVSAVTAGTLLYKAKRLPALTVSKDQMAADNGSEILHCRGDAGAPVTLEEFGDLQCPPCGALSEPINQMERDFHGRLRIVYRQYPLATHAHARDAALALEAAGLQGRFWEMHDLLYREQSAWSQAADTAPMFESYAGTLGLNIQQFRKDATSQEVKARVTADEKRGVKLGVSTTPTIFVNAIPVPPASLRPDRLRETVEAALKPKTLH